MTTCPLRYAQGSAGAVILMDLTNACDGLPIDLTGATVVVNVRAPDQTELTAADVVVSNAGAGQVRFTLTTAETAQVGCYDFQLEVTDSDPAWNDTTSERQYYVFDPIGTL